MDATQTLQTTVSLFERLGSVRWTESSVMGELLFDMTWSEEFGKLADDGIVEFGLAGRTLTWRELRNRNPIGERVTITISPPDSSNAFFARNLDDLLVKPEFRYRAPDYFYLATERVFYPRDAGEPVSTGYLEAIRLLGLLREAADHSESRAAELWLVFLTSDGKVEFPVAYRATDLSAVTGVTELREEVTSPPHAKAKRELFRSAITDLVAHVGTPDRLGTLLRLYPDAEKRFRNNHALYVSEFSFETEREKLETLKREYMLKLNGAVGEIHTKLIAIPTAVVLVAGQMKTPNSVPNLISNVVLLVGAVVFAVLMFMVTINQKHSLEAIRSEYSHRRIRLQGELPKLFQQFEEPFRELEKRYVHQRWLIKVINWLVVIGLLFSIAVFVAYFFLPTPKEEPASIFHLLVNGALT